MNPGRRKFLQSLGCCVTIELIPNINFAYQPKVKQLAAAPAEVPLVLEFGPATEVWAYNGQVPGPLLRYQQGDTLRIELENLLEEPTTIHWHGLRVPVTMDGVPVVSQPAVPPGEKFRYEFVLEDAGTFWYHPHVSSSKQVGKGLRGVLIVDEKVPPEVNRDVLWVLDDWRLNQEAQIVPFSGNRHDASHNGRMGNVVTVNGNIGEEFTVYPGERMRLRLVNVSNARTFSLQFKPIIPWLIALDGHPVTPRKIDDEQVVLGAGQRADLIVDIPESPSESLPVIDHSFGSEFAYELMHLVFDSTQTYSSSVSAPAKLPANPVPAPNLHQAIKHKMVFEGGAMGGLSGAILNGTYLNMRELVERDKFWALNGMVPDDVLTDPPILTLKRGQSYIFELINRTAFEHPIHLHGHSVFVISANELPVEFPMIRDTILIAPNEKQEIAFVADNPGIWMFHCHVLEHQETGMTSMIAVI